jgi:NifU-like protein involved in Fe-S cluster formation
MADTLYNAAILRLKLAGEVAQRLPAPTASAVRVSPVCGSKVIADVVADAAGRVTALGLDATRACTLGQASAAVALAELPGRDAGALDQLRTLLADYLAGRSDTPPPGWGVFAPARAHRARHPSILLPLDAALAALAAATPLKDSA